MAQRYIFIEHPSCKAGSTNNLWVLKEIMTGPNGEVSNEPF